MDLLDGLLRMDTSVENILFKHLGGHLYLFGFGRRLQMQCRSKTKLWPSQALKVGSLSFIHNIELVFLNIW